MINGLDKDLLSQIEVLEKILLSNSTLKEVLVRLSQTDLKNYYVAAGCINQTIFNYYHFEFRYFTNFFLKL